MPICIARRDREAEGQSITARYMLETTTIPRDTLPEMIPFKELVLAYVKHLLDEEFAGNELALARASKIAQPSINQAGNGKGERNATAGWLEKISANMEIPMSDILAKMATLAAKIEASLPLDATVATRSLASPKFAAQSRKLASGRHRKGRRPASQPDAASAPPPDRDPAPSR